MFPLKIKSKKNVENMLFNPENQVIVESALINLKHIHTSSKKKYGDRDRDKDK